MQRNAESILIILLLLLVSCEKDEKPLIGKWNMVSSTLVNYYKNEMVSDTIFNYGPGQNVLELLADGTARIYRFDDLTGTYKWDISGNLLIINYYKSIIGSSSGRFEYSIYNSTLYLRSEGVTKQHNNNYRFVLTDTYARF